MVEVAVPGGAPKDEVFHVARRWTGIGFYPDLDYQPVRMTPAREGDEAAPQVFLLRGWLDPAQFDALAEQPQVVRVLSDTRVEPFPPPRVDCTTTGTPIGDASRVAKELGVDWIWAAGFRGSGIVVGVVDAGITAHGRPIKAGERAAIPAPPAVGRVTGGWPADWGTTAVGWGQHGNMMAFDVQAMAPEAELWDIRIWSPDVGGAGYVSNAVSGYRAAIDNYRAHGIPHILSNSWGVYDSATDPVYAFSPTSPLARLVEEAMNAGILVLFAAGNCGGGCPFGVHSLCGAHDRGPGNSILGPNGHPRVMTVGAATIADEWCGYTSQGPAALPPQDIEKPDFCSYTAFDGFFPLADPALRDFDGGTSAATAVAAGVVALLKQRWPGLGQDDAKRILRATARDIGPHGTDRNSGAGIIQAKAAFKWL
jgi:subtilisin family serine protease